jgi:hypothetical protein
MSTIDTTDHPALAAATAAVAAGNEAIAAFITGPHLRDLVDLEKDGDPAMAAWSILHKKTGKDLLSVVHDQVRRIRDDLKAQELARQEEGERRAEAEAYEGALAELAVICKEDALVAKARELCATAKEVQVWIDAARKKAAQGRMEARAERLNNRGRGVHVVLPSVGPDDDTVTVPLAAAAIFRVLAEGGDTFIRGGRMTRLQDDEGVQVLVPMTAIDLVAYLPRILDLFAWRWTDKGPALKPVAKIPADTAAAIMAAQEAREILPPVATVLRSPGLAVDDGKLVTLRPGYNGIAGGIFVTGAAAIPAVPLAEAWQTLHEIVGDFHFKTPSDKSRAIASFITPALRMALLINGHIPLELFEADKPQTGKTFGHTLRAAVYGEELAVITQRTGGVGSLDESVSQRLLIFRI